MVGLSLKELNISNIEKKTALFKNRDLILTLNNKVVTYESVTIEAEREFFLSTIKSVKEKKDLVFEIFLGNKFIGIIGTKGIDFVKLESEIGFWIGKKYWGKGYITKAINLFINEVFSKFKLKKLVAVSFESNIASVKALKRNGFVVVKKENVIHPITKEQVVDVYLELINKK